MNRFVVAMVLGLLCIASPTSVEAKPEKSSVDMSNMNKIFVGWVDWDPDEYRVLNYSTKEDWVKDIERANIYFQGDLKAGLLAGRTLTMAKNRDDVNAAGNDLYIKFTDVAEDKGYRLHVAVHFIDPKTDTELALVASDVYSARGHFCVLEGCMQLELNKVGELVKKMVSPPKK